LGPIPLSSGRGTLFPTGHEPPIAVAPRLSPKRLSSEAPLSSTPAEGGTAIAQQVELLGGKPAQKQPPAVAAAAGSEERPLARPMRPHLTRPR
jgi:hypothetical protein